MANDDLFTIPLQVERINHPYPGLVEFVPIGGDTMKITSQEERKKEVAPLVSAENYSVDGIGWLRVRILVFIGNQDGDPEIGWANNYSSFYIQSKKPENSPDSTSYRMWYYHFNVETTFMVNQITVFNTLEDPKTSRGTVTTVQSTMP